MAADFSETETEMERRRDGERHPLVSRAAFPDRLQEAPTHSSSSWGLCEPGGGECPRRAGPWPLNGAQPLLSLILGLLFVLEDMPTPEEDEEPRDPSWRTVGALYMWSPPAGLPSRRARVGEESSSG